MKRFIWLIIAYGLASFTVGAAPTKGLSEYYIGVDRQTILEFGVYTGLPNTNLGRLTLLLNHGDHFHGIGAFSYTGSVDQAELSPTNSNNRIPETFSGQAPLALSPGEGTLYSDKLVNQHSDTEYSNLAFASIQALRSGEPGSDASILFRSSKTRWVQRFSQATLALQLVSKTEGLHIGTANDLDVLDHSGDFIILGKGDNQKLMFKPVFWVEGDAPAGTYSAEFRLLDLNPAPKRRIKPSGTFNFDFSVPAN